MDLTDGWEAAATAPGRCATPADLAGAGLEWVPATVPGTAAGAVGADGRDFDAEDWWFRCRFATDEASAQTELRLGGVATVAEVYLNGKLILESESMFASHRVDLAGRLGAENELVIACRALVPLLARRRRPSARWRTRVVNAGNLRWYRTMMFGRSPGFAPGPAPVGPWRPVSLAAPDPLESLRVRARVVGSDGIVTLTVPSAGALPQGCEARIADVRAALRAETELVVPGAALWWPHTHGDPVLHDLVVARDGETLARRRIGFRALGWAQDIPRDGLDLEVNGVPMWARGAVWTPADLVSMAPSPETLRALLQRVRDAGMNMVRVVGTGAYEPPAFFDLCDELGILVWQDLMFGNLDYPGLRPGLPGGRAARGGRGARGRRRPAQPRRRLRQQRGRAAAGHDGPGTRAGA